MLLAAAAVDGAALGVGVFVVVALGGLGGGGGCCCCGAIGAVGAAHESMPNIINCYQLIRYIPKLNYNL